MNHGDSQDWLARNGGWVLLSFGIALVVVSVVIADQQAVASILAFSGVATAVFGVLLSRLEGGFELSPTKFAATLRQARDVSIRDDLTIEERAELVFRLLGVGGEPDEAATRSIPAPGSATGPEAPAPATPPGPRAPAPVDLPKAREFIVTGATDQVHRVAMAFESHVAELLRNAGWEVTPQSPDRGMDFRIEKDGRRAYVEVKLHRRMGQADVRRILERSYAGAQDQLDGPIVLAVNVGALSSAARHSLREASSVQVWEIPVEGW